MSRPPSRLHQLERSLQLARPPRERRRKRKTVTTVMRLGSATADLERRPRAQAVPLPAEIERQVEVVRGRAAATPSQGLLQLEQRLLGRQEVAPAPPTIQRHAHAAPSVPVSQAQAFAAPGFTPASALAGSYVVEPFEPAPAALEAPAPPAAGPDRAAQRKSRLSAGQRAAAEGFERDMAALLADGGVAPAAPAAAPEDRQWDDTLRKAAAAPEPAATPAAAPANAPAAPADAHKVFDQMGLAMNYANRFDLGAVDLSERFDQFDDEMARAPRAPPAPAPNVHAMALADADFAIDLAELRGESSAPPAAPEQPAPTLESGS